MSIWNRTLPLILARFIPILLVLTLSVFWVQEIKHRLSVQRQLEVNVDRLLEAETRIKETNTALNDAREKTIEAKAETQYLVRQLGERDEHIRRMLAEMIRLLSGNSDVNLGEISIPSDKESWRGVKREMESIVNQPPIIRQIAPITHRIPSSVVLQKSFALRQVEVEERGVQPVPGNVSASAEPKKSPPADSAPWGSDGRILAVNEEHHFVVVNRGLKDGVEEGASLIAYRNGRPIGELLVETAYDKISAAGFSPKKDFKFQVGDKVRPRQS